MDKLYFIDLMINELQGLAISTDADQSEQHLTRTVDMFEPLLLACAEEFGWRVESDGVIS